VHYIDEQHIDYPAVALVVVLDISSNTQFFFTDNDDDMVALSKGGSCTMLAIFQDA